jgi:hypothetical protein
VFVKGSRVRRWQEREEVTMSTSHNNRLAALAARTEYRFGLVLILLLATFVFLMTGATSPWTRPILAALTGTTLVVSLSAASVSAGLIRLAALVTVVGVVVSASIVAVHGSSADGAGTLLDAALVALAPIAIARSVLRRRVIDAQTVLAALCIYVLLGMLWAFVYDAIGHLGSAPFFAQSVTPTSADYVYFSYITQTTVGYGDFSAAGNPGRACAVLEALLGQVYLVTIVALLVSNLRPRARTTES